jgi:4-hydroxybenzoate polyprenyltransferase
MLADLKRVATRTQSSFKSGLYGVLLFLVHSNLFISLGATSVAVSTILLAGFSIDAVPLFIVFSVTFFVYSFNRLTDIEEDEYNLPARVSFVRRFGKPLFGVGIALYLVAAATAIVLGVPGAPAMAIPLLVAVLYSVVGFKRVLLVKNLLVGLSWGLIPLGVGFYFEAPAGVNAVFMFVFVTIALTVAAMVFDIKDIEGDRKAGIDTVPIVLGVAWTRLLAVAVCLGLALVVVAMVTVGLLDRTYLFLLPFLLYMIGYSMVAREAYGPLFYGFVIDGEHLFLAGVLLCYEFLWPALAG